MELTSGRRKSLLIFLAILGLSSCQTDKPINIATVPPTLEGLFTICNGGEGSLSISASKDDEFLGSALFDWVSDRDHRGSDWNGEFRSAFGQTILTASAGNKEIRLSGSLANQVPPVKVRQDGFLEIDGHFVPVKAKEFPCFFKFKFPRDWLTNSTHFERQADRAVFYASLPERNIEIIADGLSSPPARKICAEVSWRSFLGMVKSVAVFCHQYERQKKSNFKVSSLEVSWIDIDEQAK